MARTSPFPPALALAVAPLLLALAGCPRAPAPAPLAGPRPRVVTAAPALAELVCALGAREHLAGVSRYCTFPPELQALPGIGGAVDPNLEAIDALAPDLILTQARDERLDDLAGRRAFRVVPFRIETLAELRAAALELGRLLDREGAARAEVARLDRELEAVRARAPARRPRTLLVFGRTAGELGQLSAPGAATFLAEALALAGGESCVADLPGHAWHVLSLEAVLARDPELIVELHAGAVTPEQAARLRADWAPLAGVAAVREGRVAIVQGSEALVPGPRLPLLARKLAAAVAGALDVGPEDPG